MMKKSQVNQTLEIVLIIIATIAVFTILSTLSDGTAKFSASLYTGENFYLGTETYEEPITSSVSQSLFGPNLSNIPIYMMATQKIEETDETIGIFKAEVDNPFQTSAQLRYVIVSKNGKDIGGKQFISNLLQKGESYTYKSDPIDLVGIDGQKNTIFMEFMFEDLEGNKQEKFFQYDYLSLTQCISHDDCTYPTDACDKGNLARFSTDPNVWYCTKFCESSGDCYQDQICVKGYCGY